MNEFALFLTDFWHQDGDIVSGSLEGAVRDFRSAEGVSKFEKLIDQIGILYKNGDFEQNDDGVEVAIENPYEIVKLKAKYLIAADGGGSIIRKWLGAEFDGFTYSEKFLTLSTKLELKDYIDNLSYVNYVTDPKEWLVLLRVPSVWRILVPASEDQSDDFLTSDEYKEDVLYRLTGQRDVKTEHRTISVSYTHLTLPTKA